MTRALSRADASDPIVVMNALRDALTADGPAVFPVPAGTGPAAPAEVPQRIALVVETSGSSGRPKRVALTADAVLASAAASETALGGAGQWLLALPAHYIAGINVLARSITAQVDPVAAPAGHFDARAFVAAATELTGDLRFTSLVPVQLARVVELAETDADARTPLRRLDRILVGGQSTPASLLERAAALGLRVTRTYGSSETCGGCVYDGEPIGQAIMREVDGEIRLAGPMLAEEYLDDPDRTASAFVHDDGMRWYRTGDTGFVESGVLAVTGRRDRVIISGGIKLSLDEVERALRNAPGHETAVTVPVTDETWGEGFVVVTDSELSLPASALQDLGAAARPRDVIVVAAVPQLASGKPDRAALLEFVTTRR